MHCSFERAAVVLTHVANNEIKVTKAAEILGVGRRQVYRLLRKFEADGIDGLKSRKIGRPRNRLNPRVTKEALALLRKVYYDFGPTLASEKLAERNGIYMSRESVRKLMIKHGIWVDRYRRQARVKQPREPRPRFGELVQIDGSHHDWFEGRGPKCCLLVFIDDATSACLRVHFAASEHALAYMQATQDYILEYGVPDTFYSDRHSVFRNAKANLERGDRLTQFGEMLDRLDIRMINADSSEAKGRVERANRTLQDRLVKEMRLEGISDIEAANAFADRYRHKYNDMFARPPLDPEDAHRAPPNPHDLHRKIRWEETRKVSQRLTLQHNKLTYILQNSRKAHETIGRDVIVSEHPDGTIELLFKGEALPFTVFDRMRRIRQPEIVGSKRLESAFEIGRKVQEELPHHKQRNLSAPVHSKSPFLDRLDCDDRDKYLPQNPTHDQFEEMPTNYGRHLTGVPKPRPARPTRRREAEWPLASLNSGTAPRSIPSIYEDRKVSPQRSFSFHGTRYVLEENELSLDAIGMRIFVVPREGQRVEAIFKGKSLPIESYSRTNPRHDAKREATENQRLANSRDGQRSDIRLEPEDKSPPSLWPPVAPGGQDNRSSGIEADPTTERDVEIAG